MGYVIEISAVKDGDGRIWRIPPSLNARLHWSRRAEITNVFKEQVYWSCKERKIPKMQVVTITIRAASVRPPDLDNLAASVKPLIDGLVLAKIVPDDDPEHVTCLTIESRRVRTFSDENLVLTIEETPS